MDINLNFLIIVFNTYVCCIVEIPQPKRHENDILMNMTPFATFNLLLAEDSDLSLSAVAFDRHTHITDLVCEKNKVPSHIYHMQNIYLSYLLYQISMLFYLLCLSLYIYILYICFICSGGL